MNGQRRGHKRMEFTVTAPDTSADSRIPAWVTIALANGPVYGSEQQGGVHTAGDTLVSRLADGTPLDTVFDTARDLMAEWKAHRNALVSLLSFSTTEIASAVPQTLSEAQFEEATEFGEPRAVQHGDSLILGFDFKDWDTANKWTWRYLRDASQKQIDHDLNVVLEGDVRKTSGEILKRIMSPTPRLTPENHTAYGLWTGSDSIAPLPYLGKTFDDTHSHYLASGAATLDSADVEDAIRLITEHGYGRSIGSQILVIANQSETDRIATWRAGEASRSSGPIAKFDFIPSEQAPPYLTDKTIVGKLAPADLSGVKVLGSYGESWVIPTELIPTGYVLVVATAGPNSPQNVVGFREHVLAEYRGLRLIAGAGRYPLQDAFFQRSFGTGVRHRGAAVAIQVTTESSYLAPAIAV